jgi:hypothetical protein
MKKTITATVCVTAPRDAVLRACDPALLAAWNNEYIGCAECVWITDDSNWDKVGFSGMGCGGVTLFGGGAQLPSGVAGNCSGEISTG